MDARNERLAELLRRYNANPTAFAATNEYAEFTSLMREIGFRKTDKCCACDGGFACNPDDPPPNCGKCTCIVC